MCWRKLCAGQETGQKQRDDKGDGKGKLLHFLQIIISLYSTHPALS
jgi:hypothetical protein